MPRARGVVALGLILWTGLLCRELPLGSGGAELYADWDHQLLEAEVAARAVREGELPFWNPFPCGGLPSFARPLSRSATPFFLLHLALGPSKALRWEIVLHLLLAALGTAVWIARHVPGSPRERAPAALLGGMVYSGSTFFSLHLTEGHLWMLTAAYLPWVLTCFERGVGRPAFAALAGVLLALIFGEGGALPLPLVTLLLGFYAVWLALRDRSSAPLVALGIAGAVMVLLGAPKLLPMLEFLQRNPRETPDQIALPLRAVVHGLFDRDQALGRSYDWLYWGWQEQGHYLGVVVTALAAIGCATRVRVARVYAGLALLFAVLAMGPFHDLAPWNLIHRLPLLSALHVTSRFLVVSVLMLAALAGFGLSGLLTRVSSPNARLALAGVVLLVVGTDLLAVNRGIFAILGQRPCPPRAWPADAPRGNPIVTLQREPREMRRCRAPGAYVRSAMVPAAREGVAIVRAYSALCPRDRRTNLVDPRPLLRNARVPDTVAELRVPRNFGRKPGLRGVGDPDYRGELWVEAGDATARIAQRSMNRQHIAVDARGRARIVLNQNWDPGWRTSHGGLSGDAAGRLVLELPDAYRGEIALAFRPFHWREGLAGFALGCVAVAVAVLGDRRRHPSAAPPAPGGR